jgi:hypothetical protein
MRKALIVGINYYENKGNLGGCCADAQEVERVLSRHGDGQRNFECDLLAANGFQNKIDRHLLRRKVEMFFRDRSDVGLFYFAGHGLIEPAGGYLMASNAHEISDGLALNDLLTWVNQSPISHKLVILDCCHSGALATPPDRPTMAMLAEGVVVLTASTATQQVAETQGSGLFSRLMVEALDGAAASLTGDVTPGGLYAFIDQSLGAFQQRPVFKSNVQQFVSLRRSKPPIALADLHRITDFFLDKEEEHKLDPSYEPAEDASDRKPGDPPPDPEKTKIFKILQQYNRLHLVLPVGEEHMYYAAMRYKSCRLTPLGQHYWRLVKDGRI